MSNTLLKAVRIAATTMLINTGPLSPHAAIAQTGIKRTDLQRHDLGTS